ncbi:alpha/beta hydrolase-fold protein [uncultured Ilyobacter sp.]|uniref:alpha/beta hydrolase n=1 Tax=uncultured Ilyobacter sp. TaxID=544433 RepID=UPI0029C09061|nr:alpha/beta hydrolase-fold protein [uncultured Ilyobacter sp.]
MLGFIWWLTLFLLIFYLMTGTSEKKIKRKIDKTLTFPGVWYREKMVEWEWESEALPFSKDIKIRVRYIKSFCTGENMRYIVMSPRILKEKKYPCVFLLHGMRDSADDWLERAKIIENYEGLLHCGKIGEMILVMPDSGYNGESWYADFIKRKSHDYESYFVKELLPKIRSEYPIGSIGIAGFSMGGHGALKIALRNIEEFKAAGSFAGAISLIRLAVNRRVMRVIRMLYVPQFIFGEGDGRHFVQVFGSWGHQIIKQDPYSLIKAYGRKNPNKLKDKYFYLSVGDEDKEPYLMLQQWIDVVGRLKKYGFNYNAHLYRGESHSWNYVAKDLPNLLKYFYDKLK